MKSSVYLRNTIISNTGLSVYQTPRRHRLNLHSPKHPGQVARTPRLVEKVVLLEHDDIGTGLGRLVCSSQADGPAADHDNVVQCEGHGLWG